MAWGLSSEMPFLWERKYDICTQGSLDHLTMVSFSRWPWRVDTFSLRCRFILMRNVRMEPTIIPLNTHRKMMMAREAWNRQKRKEIDTGAAFCTENMATINTIIKATMILAMAPPSRFFPYNRGLTHRSDTFDYTSKLPASHLFVILFGILKNRLTECIGRFLRPL
jgi:hypothetical protein